MPGHSEPRAGLPGGTTWCELRVTSLRCWRHWRTGLPWRNWGSLRRRPWKKAGVIEKRRIWTDGALADYIRDELGFPGARQGAMVEKEAVDIGTGEVSRERWYLLTSLSSWRCGPKELLRVSPPNVHALASQDLRLPPNADHRPPLRSTLLTLQSLINRPTHRQLRFRNHWNGVRTACIHVKDRSWDQCVQKRSTQKMRTSTRCAVRDWERYMPPWSTPRWWPRP